MRSSQNNVDLPPTKILFCRYLLTNTDKSQKARAPQLDFPPLRVIRMSDIAFGITTVAVDGVVNIPVTDVAKTIVDCFKFRNKIGLDIALEALRDAWHQKKVTMDELWQAAEHCRVANVMRPYLESLVLQ